MYFSVTLLPIKTMPAYCWQVSRLFGVKFKKGDEYCQGSKNMTPNELLLHVH